MAGGVEQLDTADERGVEERGATIGGLVVGDMEPLETADEERGVMQVARGLMVEDTEPFGVEEPPVALTYFTARGLVTLWLATLGISGQGAVGV